jgi:enolase
MSAIKNIHAREILDSRGNPTVEVEVELESGIKAVAAVPSGASTGAYEAVELRDNEPTRYGGQGVLKAVDNVNSFISKALKGVNANDQEKIDKKMIALDGKEDKSELGANALLGVSLAVCRASAIEEKIPLYKYINKIFNFKLKNQNFPVPMFNVFNGGKHSDSGLSVQEFMLIPTGIISFAEQLRAGSEIFHTLKKILAKADFSTSVGDEGGFSPWIEGNVQALEFMVKAIKESGYIMGAQLNLGMDVAANSFYQKDEDQYLLKPEMVTLAKEGLINIYRELVDKYYVVSIEDGLEEEDWEGWKLMMEKLGRKPLLRGISRNIIKEHLIIGDDLLVTNVKRLKKAIAENACNGAIVKLNQIGTLTETLEFVKLAKENNIKTIVSHRSGETIDDFIADLAVGVGADFIKTGSLSRGERICKYNRLLKIEEEIK